MSGVGQANVGYEYFYEPVRVLTSAGPYQQLQTDKVLVVNQTVGAAMAITLVANPVSGKRVTIIDGKGDSFTNNITITPASGLIINTSNYVISSPFGAVDLIYTGSQWATYNDAASGIKTALSGQMLSGLLAEYPVTNITAASAGTQAAATQLTGQTNVITSGGAGYSVLLPSPIAGLEIEVINNTAYTLAVFGTGNDTINGQAALASITVQAYSVTEFICGSVTSGVGTWFTEGLGEGFASGGTYPLFCESAQNGITALAGGGKPTAGSAAQIAAQTSRITTSGNTGGSTNDSVLLPPASAGLELNVINSGSYSIAVWSAGTDTVDGNTYVTQMVNSMTIYSCPTNGIWVSNGIGTGYAGSFPTQSYTNGITAYAGGGQTNATLLTSCINRVTTVANANDSVKLPVSNPGVSVTVTNAAASNSMNVFPQTGDAINALSANTALAIAAGKTTTFTCAVAGQYHCFAPA